MEDLNNADEKFVEQIEDTKIEEQLETQEQEVDNEDEKLAKRTKILELLKKRREIRKQNRQITTSICMIYGKKGKDGIENKVTEVKNNMMDQAKVYGKKAVEMAKTMADIYTSNKEKVLVPYTNNRNILREYKQSLKAIEKEYLDREKYIIDGRAKFEKAEENSDLKELELRKKRDEKRKTPEYSTYIIKEQQWLEEALEQNDLVSLQEKKQKYEELREQDPLREYDDKISSEKERREKIRNVIKMCDDVLLKCQQEKENSINEATENKQNQMIENKQNVFQKTMGSFFYKINGAKKFASRVIGSLEEKIYNINNVSLPAIREDISDEIDKLIENSVNIGKASARQAKRLGRASAQGAKYIANKTGEITENMLRNSIEKAEQVNMRRSAAYNNLTRQPEELEGPER